MNSSINEINKILQTFPKGKLITFDNAIDISLAILTSSDIARATYHLGKYLRPEDLNTIWVVVDLAKRKLVKRNLSATVANERASSFRNHLRKLPGMRQVFSEMPSTEREMDELGHKIDDLVVRFTGLRGLPTSDFLLEQNPLLTSMLTDLRITRTALTWYIEGDKFSHWEIREIFAAKRTAK